MTENNEKILYIESNMPHCVCELIDINCKYRWMASFPEDILLKQLPCPKCGAVGFVIKTGQDTKGNL